MSDEVCQVEMWNAKHCGRQRYKGNEKCIFHLENKSEEDVKIFEIEFWKELERMEKDDNIKELNFTGFVFSAKMDFRKHIFEKPVIFIMSQFNGVNFENTWFKDRVDFSCRLSDAYFSNARFNNQVTFSHAEFNIADFRGVKFNDRADFIIAKFNI